MIGHKIQECGMPSVTHTVKWEKEQRQLNALREQRDSKTKKGSLCISLQSFIHPSEILTKQLCASGLIYLENKWKIQGKQLRLYYFWLTIVNLKENMTRPLLMLNSFMNSMDQTERKQGLLSRK